MSETIRAALYLRVSTDQQSVENQRQALMEVAKRRGWDVVKVYEDAGISGAKGRDKRPQFDAMMKDATRGRFNLVMVWAVDRLGRSTATVSTAMSELNDLGVGFYADKEGVNTTTHHGRAMLQMAAVFAELERGMIRDRVKAGMARAKAEQEAGKERVNADGTRKKAVGRPMIAADVERAIREHLAAGAGILKTAKLTGVGSGTVQRVKASMI